MGMTAPRPVTTARRVGSVLGATERVPPQGWAVGASVRPRRGPWASVAVVSLEDHGTVVAAEADVVREPVPEPHGRRLGRSEEVGLRVRLLEVDRRRDALL